MQDICQLFPHQNMKSNSLKLSTAKPYGMTHICVLNILGHYSDELYSETFVSWTPWAQSIVF